MKKRILILTAFILLTTTPLFAAWKEDRADKTYTEQTFSENIDLYFFKYGELDADLTLGRNFYLIDQAFANKSNWDTAYTHSQTATGNPHSLDYADIGLTANQVIDWTDTTEALTTTGSVSANEYNSSGTGAFTITSTTDTVVVNDNLSVLGGVTATGDIDLGSALTIVDGVAMYNGTEIGTGGGLDNAADEAYGVSIDGDLSIRGSLTANDSLYMPNVTFVDFQVGNHPDQPNGEFRTNGTTIIALSETGINVVVSGDLSVSHDVTANAFFLNDGTEIDSGSSAVTTHESAYNHDNYDTAYGWGDHASGGYIVSTSMDSLAEFDTQIGLTGTPSSSTYLRGDGSWSTPDAGGSGEWTDQGTYIEHTEDDVRIAKDLTVEGGLLTSVPIVFEISFDTSVSGSYLAKAPLPFASATVTQYRMIADEDLAQNLTISIFKDAVEQTSTDANRATIGSTEVGAWVTGLSYTYSSSEALGFKLHDYDNGSDLSATGYIQVWATIKEGK